MSFVSLIPPINTLQNVGVVYSRMPCPVHLFNTEWEIVEAIDKIQYSQFKENDSSLKDVLKFEESHGLDKKNILHLCTFLKTYDLVSLFPIVCPVDSQLRGCTLKTRDDDAITHDLLTNYRSSIQELPGITNTSTS